MEVFGFDQATLQAIVKFGLLVKKDLLLVTDDDEIGFHYRFVVELFSRQEAVATDDAVHMHAGLDPLTENYRIDGVGGGGDDVAAANRLLGGIGRHDFDAGL